MMRFVRFRFSVLYKVLLICMGTMVLPFASWAQCAMCRTQLENNVSAGDPGIASGINTGILYLLAMPYLAVVIIGYFWYRSSKQSPS
jgi:hypothetical protein